MIELNNEVSSAGCPALVPHLQKLIKSERKRVDVLCSLEDIFCIVVYTTKGLPLPYHKLNLKTQTDS